jgi:hypothetical protein
MRRVLIVVALALCLLAPTASAKVFFPMRDHVLVVGRETLLSVPGCDTGTGCIASYPGPVRIYLVPAGVKLALRPVETTKPPAAARPLGRLGGQGHLRLLPQRAGRFRLIALFPVGSGDDLRTMRMPVSPSFVVHPRGWHE